MRVFLETETDVRFPFDPYQTADLTVSETLRVLGCPYDAQVNVLLTDEDAIRELNRENRGIDAVTDVLSFPMISYEEAGVWDEASLMAQNAFYPGTDELVLGDIVICVPRMEEQAAQYGHSRIREFAFLTAHSMLHLCGFDHMTSQDARHMETLQEEILDHLGITREIGDA